MSTSIEIKLEFTPNPLTLKYVFSAPLKVEGTNYYLSKKEAEAYSPMASAIFGVENVGAVMISADFISVTYANMNVMRDAHESVIHVIKKQLESGDIVCTARPTDESVDEDPTVAKIKEILERDIRPALARDGGDISYIRFQENVLYVTMMGACSGCPHSAMTLKNGVLQRLKDELPEVEDIVSV